MAEDGGGWLDSDTAVSPRSYDAALMAAGAGLVATERAVAGGRTRRLHARASARAPRLPRARHGLLSVQQHRDGGDARGRASWASSGCSSSTGTCITATAPRPPSSATRTCCSSARTLAGHYPGTGQARESGNGRRRRLHGQRAAAVRRRRRRGQAGLRDAARARWPTPSNRSWCWSRPATTHRRAIRSEACASRRLRSSGWPPIWPASAARQGAPGPLFFLEGGYVPEMMAASVVATIKGMSGERAGVRSEVFARRAGRRARGARRGQALLEGRLLASTRASFLGSAYPEFAGPIPSMRSSRGRFPPTY